jgi:hypothetical protein
MTLDQAESARRRAVRMMENFSDETGAVEFDRMTAEEYADHKGIKIANPSLSPKTKRSLRIMAAKSQKVTDLEDAIRDIYDVVQEAGSTRADQLDALNKVADLCTEALPELNEDDDDSLDAEEDEED